MLLRFHFGEACLYVWCKDDIYGPDLVLPFSVGHHAPLMLVININFHLLYLIHDALDFFNFQLCERAHRDP